MISARRLGAGESNTGTARRAGGSFWLAMVVIALGGCASVDPYSVPPMAVNLQRDDAVGYCARLFADIDRRVDILGVRDAEAPRVAGFPYMRVDRFSAALAGQVAGTVQQQAWRARLRQLDETARVTELTNAALTDDDLARCRSLLADADAAAASELRSAAKVPDNYSIAMRTIGLYPLTRLPFATGISNWQAETRVVFATPLAALPVHGRLQHYVPAAPPPARTIVISAIDAIGVPVLTPAESAALFARHAPVLQIDVAGRYDEPGALKLDADDSVALDAARPVAYTRLAYTVIGGLIYPQLVYTFWFSERPASGDFDLLAGRLDGFVWRVTLDRTGNPLVYDSMHACGCYHLFIPTGRVVARAMPETLDEGLFAPQSAPTVGSGERITLRIESGSHYLQRVHATSAAPANTPTFAYSMEDERRLTVLARHGGGSRSAYGTDGLVAGSERLERWFFWPMGIESAGQMRQWGHHATAFVGRRHFDDPLLFDTYFELPSIKESMHPPLQQTAQQSLQQP